MEPGLGRLGRRLLYRVRLHARQNSRAYPLSLAGDRLGAAVAIAGGYLETAPGDRHFVTITAKGEAFLDKLMRAE